MRHLFVVALILLCGTSAFAGTGADKALALVDKTVADVAKDAAGTFAKINTGTAPYVDPADSALYVFVYNEDVEMVAHPQKDVQGRSFKGKPDVRGKMFRDNIVAGALANGSGNEDYSYRKPNEQGIHQKTTFYRLVKGSDGKKYVVCAGAYQN